MIIKNDRTNKFIYLPFYELKSKIVVIKICFLFINRLFHSTYFLINFLKLILYSLNVMLNYFYQMFSKLNFFSISIIHFFFSLMVVTLSFLYFPTHLYFDLVLHIVLVWHLTFSYGFRDSLSP